VSFQVAARHDHAREQSDRPTIYRNYCSHVYRQTKYALPAAVEIMKMKTRNAAQPVGGRIDAGLYWSTTSLAFTHL